MYRTTSAVLALLCYAPAAAAAQDPPILRLEVAKDSETVRAVLGKKAGVKLLLRNVSAGPVSVTWNPDLVSAILQDAAGKKHEVRPYETLRRTVATRRLLQVGEAIEHEVALFHSYNASKWSFCVRVQIMNSGALRRLGGGIVARRSWPHNVLNP